MDSKLTSSIVDRLNTQNQNFHGRRITGAAPSVNPNDYVIRQELTDFDKQIKQLIQPSGSSSQKSAADGFYTIVFSQSSVVSPGQLCVDYVVGEDREGIAIEAWLRVKVTPTSDLHFSWQLNGVTVLATDLVIAAGSLGPVFVDSMAISTRMVKGNLVTPVVVSGASASFVTAGLVIQRG